jgi:hypothetical protein
MASSRDCCDDGFALAGRMNERRSEPRTRTARLVEVTHDGEAAYARCRDYSDNGLRLDLTAPLALNDEITIALAPDLILCGRVAWTKGLECGVLLDGPVDSAALFHATEPPARAPRLAATLDLLDGRRPSRPPAPEPASAGRGAGTNFEPGLAVTVLTGPNHEQRGVVRWASGRIAALEFETSLIEDDRPSRGLLPPPQLH